MEKQNPLQPRQTFIHLWPPLCSTIVCVSLCVGLHGVRLAKGSRTISINGDDEEAAHYGEGYKRMTEPYCMSGVCGPATGSSPPSSQLYPSTPHHCAGMFVNNNVITIPPKRSEQSDNGHPIEPEPSRRGLFFSVSFLSPTARNAIKSKVFW